MNTKSINDIMDDLEDETKYIMVDGKPVSIRKIIDQLIHDKEQKRRLSEG